MTLLAALPSYLYSLKPENILLDYTGHIALCDFGLCKLNMSKGDTTNTFCGTPEYLAPELLIGNGYTKVVDWWTLGVLLYEMMVGIPPFYSENTNEMYRKILTDPLHFPDDSGSEGVVLSSLSKSLLSTLLDRDPLKRLGANGAEEIKKHPFFASLNWDQLFRKMITPPFRPNVASASDTSNFSDEFTSERPMDSFTEGATVLSASVQNQFQGFTYVGTEGNAMYGASVRGGNTFVPKGAL
jgi:serum/glucocorticoid-regulated kinase 2